MKARLSIFLATWLSLDGISCQTADSTHAPTILTGHRLRELAQSNGKVGPFSATDWVTLRGQPIPSLSPPFTSAIVLQSSSNDGLNVWPAFTEGKTAAIVIAEVWENVPQVWLQPWYRLLTAWDPGNPGANSLAGANAIIDIGEQSLFYSPFWELVYAVVPPTTASDQYQSAKQLFRDNLEMHRGGAGLFAPLAPSDLLPAAAQAPGFPVRPFSRDRVGNPIVGNVWLNGNAAPFALYGLNYLLSGANEFTWNSTGVIDESSLFVFVINGSSGAPVNLGLPAVIGPGPFGSGIVARFTAGGLPIFGTLTRPYLTYLPPSAGVFVPNNQADYRRYLSSLGVRVPSYDPVIDTRSDVNDYAGRITLTPNCLSSAANFPGGCQWLDSQRAIENNVAAAAIVRQELLFTSPLVFYSGQRVGL